MSLKEKPNWAIKVFYSYTHEDERLRRKLEVHLSAMKRQGLIIGWYDRDISAGTNREQEIDSQLSSSQIILLLVSPEYIASDFCYGVEKERALERHDAKEACVIPIILRPVDLTGVPFEKLNSFLSVSS